MVRSTSVGSTTIRNSNKTSKIWSIKFYCVHWTLSSVHIWSGLWPLKWTYSMLTFIVSYVNIHHVLGFRTWSWGNWRGVEGIWWDRKWKHRNVNVMRVHALLVLCMLVSAVFYICSHFVRRHRLRRRNNHKNQRLFEKRFEYDVIVSERYVDLSFVHNSYENNNSSKRTSAFAIKLCLWTLILCFFIPFVNVANGKIVLCA